ncbi:MAG: AgmX/PglI C-terminal domain-containing protein, partial [Bacillota bacterium]
QLVGVRQFDQEQIVIGHSGEVNLDLDGEGVSPIHCLIERRDTGYYICDLGSSNGTFKNGQAVLDESISSGDEVEVGPFKIVFFQGVPKPKVAPTGATETKAEETVVAATIVAEEPPKPTALPMPPAAVVKKEEIKVVPTIPVETPKVDEKPVIVAAPVRPEIRSEKSSYKKKKKGKTFAPPSEVKDLKSYLKPSKGSTVQVIVAWKERILNTYNFKETKTIRVNAGGENDIALPDGLVPKGYPIIDFSGGLRVNTTADMGLEMVSANGRLDIEELKKSGKSTSGGVGFATRVDQNEMLCISLPGGYLNLYVRFVPQAPVVPIANVMLSSSEMTGLVMSIIMVGLLALYISATTPKNWEENKQEDVQRIAQIVFNKKPTPTPTPTPPAPPAPTPTPPPQVAKPTPTPTPKKIVVADKDKVAQKKGPAQPAAAKNEVAARASEVAPKPNAQDRTKKFTSTRQGGAIKTGQTAGANAKSANKDLSKVGLFSAFGGGGARAKIDQAYTGAGEVLGMADKATGTSGFNENRAGDDLGSKFKDAGAGGKGTATQGIAGIGTKGRGSGQAAYGASEGFGSKTSVAIEGGGMEESFDGTIDKEAIRRVIRAKLHEVKSCYERALNTLEKGRKLEGKIVLGWDIVEKGQARNVKVKSSTLGNAAVENCIRDRLASWTFPEPPPGLVAEVQAYPFILNQQN